LTYAFIADQQQSWPVSVLCEVGGGGRSGFYDYLKRQAAPALSPEEIAWLERIKTIAAKPPHSYGSCRMTRQLQDEGYEVGRFKGRRCMKQAGVSVEGRRRRGPKTTDSRHGYGVAPHMLARTFDVMAPNVAWCGAIPYLWTEEGWLYVSILVDVSARKGVGWAMSDHMEQQLVTDAWQMALGRRQPEVGLIHQSDRGSQYASHAYRELLADHGIECSMRGKGEC
jgi:transposase InsO family protein